MYSVSEGNHQAHKPHCCWRLTNTFAVTELMCYRKFMPDVKRIRFSTNTFLNGFKEGFYDLIRVGYDVFISSKTLLFDPNYGHRDPHRSLWLWSLWSKSHIETFRKIHKILWKTSYVQNTPNHSFLNSSKSTEDACFFIANILNICYSLRPLKLHKTTFLLQNNIKSVFYYVVINILMCSHLTNIPGVERFY